MQLPSGFTIDERYDRVHTSDRQSRHGAYLTRNAFLNDDEPVQPPRNLRPGLSSSHRTPRSGWRSACRPKIMIGVSQRLALTAPTGWPSKNGCGCASSLSSHDWSALSA